jgi:gliding motility-associated protein GldM
MTVGGSNVEVKAGIGKYKVTASSPGEFNYKVQIAVPGPTGVEMKVAEGKYTVFPPIAAISADELNVFYVGLDNPISVAVAGVDSRNVNVGASAGQLVPAGAGKYKVLIPVRKGNDCIISVSAKMGDGRVVSMGSKKFRIRSVPKPVFRAGAIAFDKDVQLAALKVQGVAAAVLEGFVYEGVKYTIQSYKFTALTRKGPKEQNCTGSSLNPIKGILGTMNPGEYVMFTDIRAVGPGGAVYLENAVAKLK